MTGERVLVSLFGVLGVAWLGHSLTYRYWGEFAPGSGFLPFWLGVVLVALVALYLVTTRRRRGEAVTAAPAFALKRPLAIAGGLVVCVGLIETLGFVVAVALYLGWLLAAIERRSPLETLSVGIGTPVALFLIFRVALKVPLPVGPWGF